MNEVQINKIKKRADEYATSCFPYEKQFLEREAVVKCCVHVVTETIAELEKENAELKEKLKPENCLKLLAKEGYIKFTSEQLNKAKDLLKWFVWYFREGSPNLAPYKHKVEEAEQFLKEE